MGSSNVLRLWGEALRDGESIDISALNLLPKVDDSALSIGNGTVSYDVNLYGASSSGLISWDASANDLKLADAVSLMFGTGAGAGAGSAGDVEVRWDGTDLDMLPAVDDSIFKIGDGTVSFDVWLMGGAAATYVSWDASADRLKFEDSTNLVFGTGAGAGPGNAGDVTARWDGTDLDFLCTANDTVVKWGDGTTSFDFWVYGAASTRAFSWDASANTFKLEDNCLLAFGTGAGVGTGNTGDITMRWDATDLDVLASADDTVIKWGTGTNSFDMWWYGDVATAYMEFDASANQLGLFGPMRPRGFNALSTRYELRWIAGARGKPGINADILDTTEATREIADPDFEVLGTNAVSSTTAIGTAGGVVFTTTTGSADQVILVGHLDANQSAWGTVLWPTSKEIVWECLIATPATITTMTIWAGLKLTNTSTTATDNEQAFFRFQPSVNSGEWQAIYSIGGVDTEGDTNIAVTASTAYHLKITVDSSRVARFYINGALVGTSTALTSGNLIPYIGVETGTTAARSLTIYGQSMSRAL